MFHKDYYRKSSVGKKNSGRGSQWAWRQNELIGGKPPVMKYIWTLTLTESSTVVQCSAVVGCL
jgi:hypothetical protein